MSNTVKKITVVVNKSWEFAPFFEALKTIDGFENPKETHEPPSGEPMRDPVAIYEFPNTIIKLRCVEYMMHPDSDKSSSYEKTIYMPEILAEDLADLIISVSTAESTPEAQGGTAAKNTINGSVLVGSRFFMYDARKFNPNPHEYLDVTKIDQENNLPTALALEINETLSPLVRHLFKQLPYYPAETPLFAAMPAWISVGVVNIADYTLYEEADPAAYEACKEHFKDAHPYENVPVCIETTHGIVKMCASGVPTLFVSPITDRYCHFADDVKDDQNEKAAYNSGIAVGAILGTLEANPDFIEGRCGPVI